MNFQDIPVETNMGTLFARVWSPNHPTPALAGKAPIVLFHDSLGCVDLWRGFPAALSNAARRQVIAYDRLGYGKSSPNPGAQSLNFIPQEAELYFPAVRRELKFDKFIAFGHSVGGAMALHCAVNFANHCVALITESAQAFVEERTRSGIKAAELEFTQNANMERLKKYHGEKAQWVLDAWIKTWLSPEFDDWHLAEILPRVNCPLLALHGSEDEYGSSKHPQVICDHAGGKTSLKILAGVKHVPHREREDLVVQLATQFLEQEVALA